VLLDPYEVLGVSPDDTLDTIRKAYRQAAKAWHPDLHPDAPEAEERFKEAAAAWEVLSDPARRAGYDEAAGRQARGQVDPAYVELVATSVERAQDWLDRGVLPQVAARWRGHGAEAVAWALSEVESLCVPQAIQPVSWWASRRARKLAGELTFRISETPGPQALRLFRHRRGWELRILPWFLQQSRLQDAELDDVLMRLVIESALRCLAAGRLPVHPEHPDLLGVSRLRDDAEVSRVRGQWLLWGSVALVIAGMITAGKMGW
jgi:hypothetical protein